MVSVDIKNQLVPRLFIFGYSYLLIPQIVSSSMFSKTYNTLKETRAAYLFVKDIAIECGGIVFGGYIRDTYLKDFMVTSFFENAELDHSKFWDPEYDVQTVDRLLIPKDIDISFKNQFGSTSFFDKLSEASFKVTKGDAHEIYGFHHKNVTHTKFEAKFVIGGSFTMRGTDINIEIDVCVSRMEPPFANVDMLTNILVEDAGGIRVSRNIGLEIYGGSRPNTFTKKKLEGKILEMIIRKETEIFRTEENFSVKSRMIKRIAKMTQRGWTFSNIDWLKPEVSIDFLCTVCMEETSPQSSVVINGGSHFHRGCFAEYVENVDVEIDNENNHGIKCPLRGFLKF